MAPSKLRKAIGAVKDKTSIGLAKVGSSASISDLDVAIVKATRHEEYPPDERYVREVLSLTSYSRTFVSSCVRTISRRLNKTRNWVVALKSLMLIQRLLSEGDASYEHEIFFATRRGTRLLNLSDFRDTSGRANTWDFSAFVRTYALYLDEQLELRMQWRRGNHSSYVHVVEREEDEDGVCNAIVPRETPIRDMNTAKIFSKINHLMHLLERFLACRPAGAAKENRIVSVALYPVVKESFQLCYDIMDIMAILIERFMQLDIPEMIKVHEIFCRVSKQYDEVDAFYAWCKLVGIARSSEYPELEKISHSRLDMMEDYIREKSDTRHNTRPASPEPPQEEAEEEPQEEVKALPPPLVFVPAPAPDSNTSPWEAFKESSEDDWETALVQSASHLSNQKVSLPGDFDSLILDGMYQQGEMAQAVASSGVVATGSASSVALGSAGRPAMLALPAPPSAEGGATSSASYDPFAASLAIAPPPYVQMSEMEKKQKFLVQEQVMWQQYARDGMHGQVGLSKVNQSSYPHDTGSFPATY